MTDIFGQKLGQYILLEQLGEGGMAKVYNAFDSRAERNVAIKVILPSKRSSQVFLQQFEREAKAVANLTHTNIVKVLNYGVENGQPYLVMEFVPGGTLKEAMGKPLPWETAAAILAPIARALDYVHNQQIVHRDVKPSNILLHEDFRPMLSDFGIVKLLETKDESLNSAIGVGVGTPEYMPPEQGAGKEVDFRADIYSLGLVFYEMVTGEKPFTADTPMAAVIKHITDEFPLPRRINNQIPKFVEDAILRAVEKQPEKRYPSMGHFAEVLELIALGENAPKKNIIKLTKHKTKRSKVARYSLIVPLFLALFGVAYLAFPYLTKAGATATELSVAIPTTETEINMVVPTPTPTIMTGTDSIQQPTSIPEKATATAQPAAPLFSDLTLLGTPLALSQSSELQYREIARWGIGSVNVIRWSPDGQAVALGSTSGIFIYDRSTRELIHFIDPDYNIAEMIFSPDGAHILVGSFDGKVKIWNVQNGQFVRELVHEKNRETAAAPVSAITYSINGKDIAVGYQDGSINYFSQDQDSPVKILDQYLTVEDIAISGDNRFMYVSNGTNLITVLDIATWKEIAELSNPAPINIMRLSHDRQFLLSGGGKNSVYLWDLIEERLVSSFSNLGGLVTDFDFSHDDTLVAIGLNNGQIKVFEKPQSEDYSKSFVPTSVLAGSGDQIRSVAFSPGQLVLASGSWNDGLKVWDARTGNEVFSIEKSMQGINRMYFSPDGNWLATAHDGNLIRIWQVDTAQEIYRFEGYLPKGSPFSPDNVLLAIVQIPQKNRMATLQLIEVASGKVITSLSGFQPNWFVQFTHDSKLFVMGDSHAASIWDVTTWEQVSAHGGMNAGCGQYFTPQNDLLTVISDAGILFSLDQFVQDLCATKPQGLTLMYYFEKPHNALFVLGDGRVWDWNFNTDNFARIRSSSPYPLPADIFLAGHQESGFYAYASNDNLMISNVNGNAQGLTINSQDDYHYQVAFSPNRKLIALGSEYGSIHLWVMP